MNHRGRGITGLICIGLLLLTTAGAAAGELRPFTTDGCSLFPDGWPTEQDTWLECCVEHDKAYWLGGTEQERLRADRNLRDCVLDATGDSHLAELMYAGVRAGGHPLFPTWYRWAYGWPMGRGYRPLSEAEREAGQFRLREWERQKANSAP